MSQQHEFSDVEPLSDEVKADVDAAVDVVDHMALQSLDFARNEVDFDHHSQPTAIVAAAHLGASALVYFTHSLVGALREVAPELAGAISEAGTDIGAGLVEAGGHMAKELAEPLHRAAFAVVGTLSAFRNASHNP